MLDTATVGALEPLLTLGMTGTYLVQVHDEAGTTYTGTYQLGVEWLMPATKRCTSGTTLTCGTLEARTLAGVGRHDLHTFAATAGDRVWLMSRPTGGAGFAPGLAGVRPGGDVDHQRDHRDGAVARADGDRGLHGGGPRLERAEPHGDVRREGRVAGAGGEAVRGPGADVRDAGDSNVAGRDAARPLLVCRGGRRPAGPDAAEDGGDAVYTPGMVVYDPAGTPVLDTATVGALGRPALRLGATGTYLVQVHDEAGTTYTGMYQLGVEWLMPATKRRTSGTTLTCGTLEARTLAGVGRHDLHTFAATAGDRVWLMSRPTGGAGFAPYLRVDQPGR